MNNNVVRWNINDTKKINGRFSNSDQNNTSYNRCSKESPPSTNKIFLSNNSIATKDLLNATTMGNEMFKNSSTVTSSTKIKCIHTIRNSLKCDKNFILTTNSNILEKTFNAEQTQKHKHEMKDEDKADFNKNVFWPRGVENNSRDDFPLNYNEKIVHSYHSKAFPLRFYRNCDCCHQKNILWNKRTVNFKSLRLKLSKFFKFCAAIILLNLSFSFSSVAAETVKHPNSLYYNEIENNYVVNTNNAGHYTHTWALHIPNGDNGLADDVARDHGFTNLGKIFDDYYHFAHHKISKRSISPAVIHQTRIESDARVKWSEQQRVKSRQKRDFIRMRPSRTSSKASLVDAVNLNDPKWPQMWYLNRGGGLDMNVIPAWKDGITGKGIVVTILDDGLESDHPDIEDNYDPDASYDVNSHDKDPMPHYDMTDSNRHGTRCAGEVAAVANNSKCAVGIAYGARVGGVRMLDGDVTDAVEARSLSLNPQHIDIYSASWGPDDDGKTVDGPGDLASRAFLEGVTKGRNGKGSIFIWASGNGGRELDNCNCDGYTNSIWTLSISSATEDGHVPWYSEKCSSTLATTYSSGGQSEKQVVTTDLHHSCTVSHTGTSASAPLAAGIAALVLQSNQNLTWRDLQHIVVRTAKPANLKDPTWSKNGVGRRISHSFGYGLMDASAMVKVARDWKTVPEQQRCEINAPHVNKAIPAKSYITLQLSVQHCSAVNYLEHVQAKITLSSQRRGDIQLFLKSPAGTKVTLLTSRIHDVSRSGFNQWPFMSVHTWGESPHGNWQLEIHNDGRYLAQITQWDLVFHGTDVPAQPDDPVQKNMEQLSESSNEMENNDIEFDSSGQWRNMQQIGESDLSANDKTNSACINSTVDHKCLVCTTLTYLFDGRCYISCPHHTYPTKFTSTEGIPFLAEEHIIGTATVDGNKQEHPKLSNIISTGNIPPLIVYRQCSLCDVSCYDCYGPLNSQCRTCYPGSQLRKQLRTNETYCYIYAERSSGNSRDGNNFGDESHTGQGKWLMRSHVALILMIIASVIILMSLVFLITLYKRQIYLRRGNDNIAVYAYDRVALLTDDNDEIQKSDKEDIRTFSNEKKQNFVLSTHSDNLSISDSSDDEDNLFIRT